jgi:hypothetical protein
MLKKHEHLLSMLSFVVFGVCVSNERCGCGERRRKVQEEEEETEESLPQR